MTVSNFLPLFQLVVPFPFPPPTVLGTGTTIPSRYRHRSLVLVAQGRNGVPCWCVFWVCVGGLDLALQPNGSGGQGLPPGILGVDVKART